MMLLKLVVTEDPQVIEPEIIIKCSKTDAGLQQLINYIKQYTFIFQAKTEQGLCFVPAQDVYYIDSVDSKTFLYSKDKIYSCSETLYELENKLSDSSFIRISKNCILNTGYLESVSPLWNHRLEAVLVNGEKLVVTRHYIDTLKEKISE